ncbi:MAG: hypothetical protein K6U03_03270 [Firmicutes bacterium]|nr:hypothetical protein [Bacillota bacterium]
MSYPRVILPATGGGLALVALAYNRFFLSMAGLLLLILLHEMIRAVLGRVALEKEEKRPNG